jgi:chorismate synthase
MLRCFDAGESRRKGFMAVAEKFSSKQTLVRIEVKAIYMELLRIFNVKIVNRVKKIGKMMDDSSIYLLGNKALSGYKGFDACVIPAPGVDCENVFGFVIHKAFLEKFSGNSVEDIKSSCNYYMSRIIRR